MTKKTTVRPAAKAASISTGVDAGFVRELALLLSETDLSEIEVEKGDLRVRVARETRYVTAAAPQPAPVSVTVAAPVAKATAAAAPAVEVAPADHPGALKSPMVGTAYRRANPEAAPFIEIGSVVKPGDKMFLVEAMKTFNEIVATKGGTVTAILIEDGQPVEYGTTLAIVE